MAYCTVSIGSGLVDGLYGKSQFPIKSYLEKRGEAFEERSILKKLFRMETSKHWAEQYTGETAMDDFEPVGEGGNYPETGFEEGFPKAIVNETWKSQFAITQELVEDGRISTMKKRANKLITSLSEPAAAKAWRLSWASLGIQMVLGVMLKSSPLSPLRFCIFSSRRPRLSAVSSPSNRLDCAFLSTLLG